MKIVLAILLAASTVAVAQNVTAPAHPPYTKNLASPVQTPKQPNYTPQMCAVQQPSPVTKAYVNYCIKTSPHSNPGCSVNDPYGMMEAGQGGHGAYFEVLDCSWHPGKNPRNSIPAKPSEANITGGSVTLLNAAGMVTQTQTDTAKHCICLIDGHGCKAPESDTKAACEGVGGTWVMPLVVPGPILSDFASVSVGDLVIVGDVTVSKDFHQSAAVDSQTGRVVKLSDEEYAHLQKLRQSVADEEKKIAVTYGVLLVPKLIHAGTNTCLATSYITGLPSCDTDQYQSADRWQFRGQWLFINIPKAAQTEVK